MPQNVVNAVYYDPEKVCVTQTNQQVFGDLAMPLIYYVKALGYVYSKQMPQKQTHAKVQSCEYGYVQYLSIKE